MKGLYKLARAGQIPNLTGINSLYEVLDAPDCEIDTSVEQLESLIEQLLTRLF